MRVSERVSYSFYEFIYKLNQCLTTLGVIMHENDRRSAELERAAHDLPGIDRRMIDRADALNLVGDQMIFLSRMFRPVGTEPLSPENIKQSQDLAAIDAKPAEQETAEQSTKIRANGTKRRANGVQSVRPHTKRKSRTGRGKRKRPGTPLSLDNARAMAAGLRAQLASGYLPELQDGRRRVPPVDRSRFRK